MSSPVDAGMIRDAIRRRASFNAVHLARISRADVFIGRDGARPREDRRWRDLVAVIRVQADSLDVVSLRPWAPSLGVSDLLARAWPEGISDASAASDASGPDGGEGGPA